MAWPIFKDGKILFHNGAMAFSTDCCCDTYTFKACLYVHMAVSGFDQEPTGISPPLLTGLAKSRIVYHGHSKDTDELPYGKRYHAHLWIIEVCYNGQDLVDTYEGDLYSWAAFEGSIAWTGQAIGNAGDLAGKLPDCSDQQIQTKKEELLTNPGTFLREDLFGPIARDWCPEAIG